MSLANVDKTVFYKTIPFISPNKLSYSSLPKAAQENHQTTLKESKNHTMVKKIYHKKNVHSWRDLMAEQNLSTLAHVLSSRPTHHPISFHLHLTHPTSPHLHSITTIIPLHSPFFK
ncbi:unnamed protein product [Microthlaspi erraticum]|uniref:Uncharacterized protein n=1 Tax=Microthlaspi erraticum TaxID=1685480 RepID=A0A6D2I4L8_9BRAS|nr:unnamed protein product [Microthlaspi erraticum]